MFTAVRYVMWPQLKRRTGLAEWIERYPDPIPEPTVLETYRFQSGKVGTLRLQKGLAIRICNEGLGLSLVFPINLLIPISTTIPWNQFHELQEIGGIFATYVKVEVGEPVLELELPGRFASHIRERGSIGRAASQV